MRELLSYRWDNVDADGKGHVAVVSLTHEGATTVFSESQGTSEPSALPCFAADGWQASRKPRRAA
jgi:hypothetical protein